LKLKILVKKIAGATVSLHELIFWYLRPNYTILEAGANDGADTIRLSAFIKSNIYAFEPVPHLFRQLTVNTAGLPNVVIFNYALADKSGQFPMYISSGESDGSSSLLKPAEHLNMNPEVTFDQIAYVNTVTLDEWAQDNGIEKIDFMWLDMQGAEFAMLKKSKMIFPQIKVLYTEISKIELYEGQGLYIAYKKWLLDSNFTLIKEDLPWGFAGNALFVRK
jgi:FkbM family methyltransferase